MPGKHPAHGHPNFLEVAWQLQPQSKVFPTIVFPMQTVAEVSEDQYRGVLEGSGFSPDLPERTEQLEDPGAFVLEKYLEDFIVSNFETIFRGFLMRLK